MPVVHISQNSIAHRPILHILIRALNGGYCDDHRDFVIVEVPEEATMIDIWDKLSPLVVAKICEDVSTGGKIHPGVLALMKISTVLARLTITMFTTEWSNKVYRPENLVVTVND